MLEEAFNDFLMEVFILDALRDAGNEETYYGGRIAIGERQQIRIGFKLLFVRFADESLQIRLTLKGKLKRPAAHPFIGALKIVDGSRCIEPTDDMQSPESTQTRRRVGTFLQDREQRLFYRRLGR